MESFPARAVASGAAWLTGMQAFNYVIAFLFYFFIARLLSPADVGKLAVLIAMMSIYNTVTMFALNNAAIKFISEFAGRRNDIASAISGRILRALLLINIPSITACLLLSPEISALAKNPFCR